MDRILEYFVVCAEELNFSRAAQKLLISQQGLSSSIQKLENEYGVLLFDRKPRMRLTAAGEQFLVRARHILRAEEELRDSLSVFAGTVTGKITVGISGLRSRAFLPEIWKTYHEAYPGVRIVLKDVNSLQMTDALQTTSIDLYIGQCYQELPAFHTEILTDEKMICIASRELMKEYISEEMMRELAIKQDTGMSLEAFCGLADFPFILSSDTQARKNLDYYFYEHHILPGVIFESTSTQLIIELCEAGGGVGIIAQAGIPEGWQKREDMLVIPLTDETLTSRIGIVTLKGRDYPPYMEQFMKTAAESIRRRYEKH